MVDDAEHGSLFVWEELDILTCSLNSEGRHYIVAEIFNRIESI